MEIGLGWLGLVVGLAGVVAAFSSARADTAGEESAGEPVDPRPFVVYTAAITVVFSAVAMLSKPPFSPGQSMGFGFLIGGLCGVFAGILAARVGAGAVRARQMGILCSCFAGLFAASLAYVIFHGNPVWAMLGVGGGAMVAGITGLSLGPRASIYTTSFAAFCLTSAASVVFAVYHFDQPGQRGWWPVPLLIAAAVGIAVFVGIVVGAFIRSTDRPGKTAAISALVAALLVLGLGAVFAWKIVAQWELLGVLAAGIAAAAVAAWVACCAGKTEDESSLTQAGAIGAVLAVGLIVVAFKLWAGLGIGLGLIAAWAVAIPIMGLLSEEGHELKSAAASALRGLLLLVTSALLYRLFIEMYRSNLGGSDVRAHYTFIGAILGVLMPRLLFASNYKNPRGPWCKTTAIACLGLAAAASPLVLLLMWEIKAVLGFVFGLTAAMALCYVDSLRDTRRIQPEAMLALGAQLTAVAFVGPLMDIELTRVYKIVLLAVVLVAAIAWLMISGGLTRRNAE